MTRSLRRAARGAFPIDDGVSEPPVAYVVKGGQPVSSTPAGEPLAGIFRAHHDEIDMETGSTVSTVRPELDLELSDLPAYPKEGDFAIVLGAKYRVEKINPDGEGGVKLIMQKVNP